MPVTIHVDKQKIVAKVEGAFKKGLPLLAKEIRDDCNQYCKEDNGYLIASSMTKSVLEEGKIIWQTAYARRQYWEIRTAYKDVNPNASWKWCEVAKGRHLERWQRQAEALTRMNL